MLCILLWLLALPVVALACFATGVAFGRGFWLDMKWIKTRR